MIILAGLTTAAFAAEVPIGPVVPVRQEAQTSGATPVHDLAREVAFDKARRWHRTGNVLVVSGYLLTPVAGFATFLGAFSDSAPLLVGGLVGTGLGIGAGITGGILGPAAAVRATRLIDPDQQVGMGVGGVVVAVGGVVGGTALTAVGAPIGLGLVVFAPAAGAILGAVQWQIGRSGTRGAVRAQVVPTANGFVVAGVF